MLEILIGVFTLYTLIKVYVSVMQIGYISEKRLEDPVLLPPAKYKIAGDYGIKKERLSIVETTLEYLTFLFWIYGGFSWLQSLVGIDDKF